MLNTRHLRTDNTTGYKGVMAHPLKNKIRWVAVCRCGRKYRYVGKFDTPEEAAIAYDKYILEQGFDTSLNILTRM